MSKSRCTGLILHFKKCEIGGITAIFHAVTKRFLEIKNVTLFSLQNLCNGDVRTSAMELIAMPVE